VQVGSPVQKGTPLLHLNAPDLTARAAELDATADVAEHAAQRQADLLAQGIASRKDAEESAAAATAARSAATAARQLLDRTRVASPIAGVVQQVLVQQGERVAAGQPLVEVIDGSVLALVARAPAPEIAPLRVGQRAVVTAEGSGRPWPARVTGIAPAVDSLTNAATIVIRVPNGTGELHAGAGATASIILGEPRQVLVVPADALVLVGGTMSVFVVAGSDSIARARQVTVEMRREGRAAVTGEIARGEVVISRGAYGLSDSTRVLPHSADAP